MIDGDGANRISAMDGLRGWAALSVVIYHFTWELFGQTRPEFRGFIPSILGSGRFDVAIFFSISGYVLTIRRWRRDDNPPFLLAALRRYVRLTVPILATTLIAFGLMALHLTPTGEASVLIGAPVPKGVFANFEPNLGEALIFGLLTAYVPIIWHAYHPFLWTMCFELFGSFIVFGISQNQRYLREPYTPLLLAAAIWLFLLPLAACFFLGALVALLQRDGVIFRNRPGRTESALATSVVVVGVIASAFLHVPANGIGPATFRFLTPAAITGLVVTFAALRSIPISNFLTRPFSQSLGRLSFPLYLVHALVMVSFGSVLVLWAASFGPLSPLDCWLIAIASILASLAAAPLLLPVELATLDFVRGIRWVPSTRSMVARDTD